MPTEKIPIEKIPIENIPAAKMPTENMPDAKTPRAKLPAAKYPAEKLPAASTGNPAILLTPASRNTAAIAKSISEIAPETQEVFTIS